MSQHKLRSLSLLAVVGIAGLLATGCMKQEPISPLTQLQNARKAIDETKKKGWDEQCIKDLETRLLKARGTYYSCAEAEAGRLAQGIIADTNNCAPKAAPAPANRPPVARLSVPEKSDVNVPITMDGSASSDPDNDKLTYVWDFGDGQTEKLPSPRTSHRYAKPGSYVVRLTVDDGKGGSDTASARVAISQKIVLAESKGRVLFDFDKANLKPAAVQELAAVVQILRENSTLGADLVGHADSVGSDQYNLGLSQRRAEAVKNYLVSQGIAASKISVDWKGESEPAVPNTSDENRARNRRVEITIRPLQ